MWKGRPVIPTRVVPVRLLCSVGAWCLVGGVACSRSPVARLPEVSVPLEFGSSSEEKEKEEAELRGEKGESEEGSGPEAKADRAVSGREGPGQGPQGRAPDPPALRSSRQYELELRYVRGTVELAGARERNFPQPVVTARRLGRFAVELWIGLELVERVRFDFPLLAAEESPGPSLERGLVATQRVLVPATERPTRALLIDRATGQEIEIPWPPVSGEKKRSSAGVEAASEPDVASE